MRLLAIALLLALPSVLALNASGDGYVVPVFGDGLAGGAGSGDSYNASIRLASSGGVIAGDGYHATIGLYDVTPLAAPVQAPIPTVDSSGGGSGGEFTPPSPITREGITLSLPVYGKHTFMFQEMRHLVRISRVEGKLVTFVFMSDPVNVTVAEGNESVVDVTNDGEPDIVVSVFEVSAKGVRFALRVASEPSDVPATIPATPPNATPQEPPTVLSPSPPITEVLAETAAKGISVVGWGGILIGISLLVLMGAYFFEKREKKGR